MPKIATTSQSRWLSDQQNHCGGEISHLSIERIVRGTYSLLLYCRQSTVLNDAIAPPDSIIHDQALYLDLGTFDVEPSRYGPTLIDRLIVPTGIFMWS